MDPRSCTIIHIPLTMVSVSDFIHLPYTRDLTEGGIAYVLRVLPSSYQRADGSQYDRLRRMVGGAAVELAFRRYLAEREIPYDVKGARPFTDPERYDVALAGQRCEIKSFLISRREQVSQIKQNPKILLNVPALVASDQNAAEGHLNSDIYLFAFLPGFVASSKDDRQKVVQNSQPYYLLHVMPDSWMRPQKWNPLGKLVLKSDSEQSQILEIGGQEAGGELRSIEVEIPPQTRIEIEDRFFSIAYIHTKNSSNARIGIHSPVRKETHIIGESDWGNIWVYGIDILLTGYLTRQEFNRRATYLREGTRTFQYDRTRTKNLAVNICDLRPVSELLEHAKE